MSKDLFTVATLVVLYVNSDVTTAVPTFITGMVGVSDS